MIRRPGAGVMETGSWITGVGVELLRYGRHWPPVRARLAHVASAYDGTACPTRMAGGRNGRAAVPHHCAFRVSNKHVSPAIPYDMNAPSTGPSSLTFSGDRAVRDHLEENITHLRWRICLTVTATVEMFQLPSRTMVEMFFEAVPGTHHGAGRHRLRLARPETENRSVDVTFAMADHPRD